MCLFSPFPQKITFFNPFPLGAILPVHHLHCVHHAAVPMVVRGGTERAHIAVPHRGAHIAAHRIQRRAHAAPRQPGETLQQPLILSGDHT